jgi:asparagine synthetase B (glutamine-hydrolysing)
MDRALLTACDAVGLRAPAFVFRGDVLAVSSRAALLLMHPAVAGSWDSTFIANALIGGWAQPSRHTAFRGVERMVGGQGLRASAGTLQRFDADRLTPRPTKAREAVFALGDVLDRAVTSPDLERSCVALSGGLDSCVIASSVLRAVPEFHAFSVVRPGTGLGPHLHDVLRALPGLRHHSIAACPVDGFGFDAIPIADEPGAGLVLQPSRLALFRAAREAGFSRVYDGEGADELFDFLWRPADLVRDHAFVSLLRGLALRGRRRALLLDLFLSAGGPLSAIAMKRTLGILRAARPWLRNCFWSSDPFRTAFEGAISFARSPAPIDRLHVLVSGLAGHWRTQELARRTAGVEGASPYLMREVIELVVGLRPRSALELQRGKALLRRVASQRVPAAIARRNKREPLAEWLVDDWLARGENVARTGAQIESSSILSQYVDARAFLAYASAARSRPVLAGGAVELGALAQWVSVVESARLLTN